MHTVKCILWNAYCEIHTVKCILWNLYCEMHTVKCILLNSCCKIHSVRGGGPLVISPKCRLISWLFLAPRPPLHFLHKSFPGTSDKISHCAKFHSSSCLISWLPKSNLYETTEPRPPLCMLWSAYCEKHTEKCILWNAYREMHTKKCLLQNAYWEMDTVKCTLWHAYCSMLLWKTVNKMLFFFL